MQVNGKTGEAMPTAVQTISGDPDLMDTADARRYVGPYPKNYVKFNGDETWRIVGIYGDKLKIVKASGPLHDMQINPTMADGNAWEGSTLETYLNSTYYSSLSDEAKAMIYDNGEWLAGGITINDTASSAYNKAKTVTVNRKVGIVSAYEFLYAPSDTSCYSVSGQKYASNNCGKSTKNWLNREVAWTWTLTPLVKDSGTNGTNNGIQTNGLLGNGSVNNRWLAYPMVYLKPSIRIVSGTGTSTDPYVLG